MHDPFAAAPEPPADRSRVGCGLALLGLFLLGFVGVLAMLFLRAPGGPSIPGAGRGESPLAALLREPPGYVRLDDAGSGGGRLSEGQAATVLGRADVPGYSDGVLRAWGRNPGEPPRAVVVLLVEVETGAQATALKDGYVARARAAGATAFATPGPLGGEGLHDVPDASGRHAQRVVFTRGVRLFVVSVVSPQRERDTTEVVELAEQQAVVR